MVDEFELRIGGSAYVGWTSIRLTKSLEQLAHSFAISLTDRWVAGETVEPHAVQAGQSCSIVVADKPLINGYVDTDRKDYDAGSRRISINGRSKTGDLVDCSSVYKTGKWRNQRLLNIAKNLCDPFKINVWANPEVDLGSRMNLSIEEGESVFNTLERAARMRGVLLLTDTNGDLFFDRVSTTRIATVLEFGVNIKQSSYSNNWATRHSEYTIKSQAAGGDNLFGAAAAQIKRSVTDEAITRYRPIRLTAENESSGSELKKRVTWERNTRAGRSKRVSYTVQGWRHTDGFWAPNQLVQVKDPQQRIDDQLLVASVTFTRSESEGTISQLELAQPEAFGVEPLPKPKRKKESFW